MQKLLRFKKRIPENSLLDPTDMLPRYWKPYESAHIDEFGTKSVQQVVLEKDLPLEIAHSLCDKLSLM
jgi:hypothetical protein